MIQDKLLLLPSLLLFTDAPLQPDMELILPLLYQSCLYNSSFKACIVFYARELGLKITLPWAWTWRTFSDPTQFAVGPQPDCHDTRANLLLATKLLPSLGALVGSIETVILVARETDDDFPACFRLTGQMPTSVLLVKCPDGQAIHDKTSHQPTRIRFHITSHRRQLVDAFSWLRARLIRAHLFIRLAARGSSLGDGRAVKLGPGCSDLTLWRPQT